MSTDADDGRNNDGGTTKIDARVPTATVDAIDEEFVRRGYTSRLETIRNALHDWLDPSIQLSEETLADLQESWARREADETISFDDALDRHDVDIGNSQAWTTDVEITPKTDNHWSTSTLKHENGSWGDSPKPESGPTTESNASPDGPTTNYALVIIRQY